MRREVGYNDRRSRRDDDRDRYARQGEYTLFGGRRDYGGTELRRSQSDGAWNSRGREADLRNDSYRRRGYSDDDSSYRRREYGDDSRGRGNEWNRGRDDFRRRDGDDFFRSDVRLFLWSFWRLITVVVIMYVVLVFERGVRDFFFYVWEWLMFVNVHLLQVRRSAFRVRLDPDARPAVRKMTWCKCWSGGAILVRRLVVRVWIRRWWYDG